MPSPGTMRVVARPRLCHIALSLALSLAPYQALYPARRRIQHMLQPVQAVQLALWSARLPPRLQGSQKHRFRGSSSNNSVTLAWRRLLQGQRVVRRGLQVGAPSDSTQRFCVSFSVAFQLCVVVQLLRSSRRPGFVLTLALCAVHCGGSMPVQAGHAHTHADGWAGAGPAATAAWPSPWLTGAGGAGGGTSDLEESIASVVENLVENSTNPTNPEDLAVWRV